MEASGKNKHGFPLRQALAAGGAGALLLLLLLFFCALCVNAEWLRPARAAGVGRGLLALAACVSAALACHGQERSRAALAGVSLCLPAACLLLLGLRGGGQGLLGVPMLWNLLCILGGGALGCLIPGRRRRRRKRGRRLQSAINSGQGYRKS